MGRACPYSPHRLVGRTAARIRALTSRTLLAAILISLALLSLTAPAPVAGQEDPIHPDFPKPPALSTSVDFWKRIYTEFGIGDFVLHDRDNLAMIYDVVHVTGATNEWRAAEAARPEIHRLRARYKECSPVSPTASPAEKLGFRGARGGPGLGLPLRAGSPAPRRRESPGPAGTPGEGGGGMQRARALLPRFSPFSGATTSPKNLPPYPWWSPPSTPRPALRPARLASGNLSLHRETLQHYHASSR